MKSVSKNKNIFLINPPTPRGSVKEPHLGLISLGSQLKRQENYSIYYLDFNFKGASKVLGNLMLRSSSASDIFLVTGSSFNQTQALQIIKRIKAFVPNSTVIVGEGHFSFKNRAFLKKYNIDILIKGRADTVIGEILDKVNCIPKYSIIESPFSKQDIYFDFQICKKELEEIKYIPIMLKVGCPFNCSFCLSPVLWRRNLIPTSFSIRSINELLYECEISDITFRDDNLFLYPQIALNFLNNLDIDELTFSAGTSINFVEENFLMKWYEKGLRYLRVGLESIFKKDRQIVNKPYSNLSEKEIIKKLKLLSEMPFNVHVNIMLGIPTQTRYDLLKMLEVLKDYNNQHLRYCINILNPLPGTLIFDSPQDFGVTFNKDFYKQDINLKLSEPIISTKYLTKEDIKDIYKLYLDSLVTVNEWR